MRGASGRGAWFADLPKEAQHRLRVLARADAACTPLATPALRTWRANGCRVGGPVWAAACWEAAAKDSTTPERRLMALAYARAIIAAAKGEATPEAQAAP